MGFLPLAPAILFSVSFALFAVQDGALEKLQKDVIALAAPEMAGRGNGHEGLEKAIDYIAESYKKIGLEPAVQTFPYHLASSTKKKPDGFLKNVVATVQGHDKELRSQFIVIGAHLDHLGTRKTLGGQEAIFLGADDNASGSAALLELARHFKENPPARSLIFVHFSGEEWGMLGSQHWAGHPTVDIGAVRMMVNLDMVGRLRSDKKLTLTAMGFGQDDVAKAAAMAPEGIRIQADRGTSIFAWASDHAPFVAKKIPSLFLFTGLHADYHRKTDTSDKINWQGLSEVTRYAQALITHYASAKDMPEFVPADRPGLAKGGGK
jgi:Zn-dependent M28 family amino/carboxypeptidase